MSVGNRSRVHWIRLKEQPTLTASALASMVLASPGTSSNRKWPSQNHETKERRICCRLPTIAFSTLAIIFLVTSLTSLMVASFSTIERGHGRWFRSTLQPAHLDVRRILTVARADRHAHHGCGHAARNRAVIPRRYSECAAIAALSSFLACLAIIIPVLFSKKNELGGFL